MRTSIWTRLLTATAAVGMLTSIHGTAQAREPEDCQLAWGQAVRSYLTQNRTKGPEDDVFAPACKIESGGDVSAARVEAVLIGVRALARLDPRGCHRFLEVYVESTKPGDICAQALKSSPEQLRAMIQESLPPRPKRKSK